MIWIFYLFQILFLLMFDKLIDLYRKWTTQWFIKIILELVLIRYLLYFIYFLQFIHCILKLPIAVFHISYFFNIYCRHFNMTIFPWKFRIDKTAFIRVCRSEIRAVVFWWHLGSCILLKNGIFLILNTYNTVSRGVYVCTYIFLVFLLFFQTIPVCHFFELI